MATTAIEYADRISHLPDNIIDDILSFLQTPDVVHLSVLSKEWYRLFTCFPISTDFSDSFFTTDDAVDRRLEFATFVFNSLLRQCRNKRIIPNFQFSVTKKYFDDSTSPQMQRQLRNLIDRSIGLSTIKGVKEISIEFPDPYHDLSFYKLPKAIYSAKELVVLRLVGCSLTKPIKLPSLQEFYLKDVYIHEQKIIDNLVLTCPLIEKFSLIGCNFLGYLKLSGFTKLRKVKVDFKGSYGVKRIDIDALTLQTFSFRGGWQHRQALINFTSCKNLEVFKIKRAEITDSIIQDINSEFPALKVLVLDCYLREKIQISCLQLEKLQLICRTKVEAAFINAPRLQSFKHSFRSIPSLFSINKTMLQEVSLEFSLNDLYDAHHDRFLDTLQEYVRNFDQINLVTLHINHETFDAEICDVFAYKKNHVSNIASPFFLDINHLELKINFRFPRYYNSCAKFMDDLFWMYRPESFLFLPGYGENYEFMKVLCKKIMRRGKHQNCCSETKVKCWRHDLKGFKIEHCRKNGGRKVLECDTLFDSLQTFAPEEKICFVFEW